MEASALQAPAGLTRTRISIGAQLLRLRTDEQLVAHFRAGSEEAFRIIHDRYRQRLFAYTRQMLPGCRQDAEDALQDVFVRAYAALRADDRNLALRAWLYRVAHNRCVDELRRPAHVCSDAAFELVRAPAATSDPIAEAERRDSLRRLIADVRRLPGQQRSALLMRELAGMPYAEIATALSITVPAVKSLLVRARVGLAQAALARDTACAEIRAELAGAHDRGVRPSGLARRHLHDCSSCRDFRRELRGMSRSFAALTPALGPLGLLAKLLGVGGGASGGAAGLGGSAAGVSGSGVAVSSGGLAFTSLAAGGATGHLATLLAAAVVTAGGAVELQRTALSPAPRSAHGSAAVARAHAASVGGSTAGVAPSQRQSDESAVTRSSAAVSVAPASGPGPARASRLAAGAAAGPAAATGGVDELDPAANGDPTAATAGSGTAGPAGAAVASAGALAGAMAGSVSSAILPPASSSGGSKSSSSSTTTTGSSTAQSSSGNGSGKSGTTGTMGTGSASGGSTATAAPAGGQSPAGGAGTTSSGGSAASGGTSTTSSSGTSTGTTSQPASGASGTTSTSGGSATGGTGH